MNDRVEAPQVLRPDVPNIFLDPWHVGDLAAAFKGAAFVQVTVAARYIVAGGKKHRRHDRADVAEVAGNKNLHEHLRGAGRTIGHGLSCDHAAQSLHGPEVRTAVQWNRLMIGHRIATGSITSYDLALPLGATGCGRK